MLSPTSILAGIALPSFWVSLYAAKTVIGITDIIRVKATATAVKILVNRFILFPPVDHASDDTA